MNKMRVMKLCPRCATMLVIRTNRQNDSKFLGCSNYPKCDYTEPLTEYLKLRMAGARDMFDAPDEPEPLDNL
jgi:ssDNA-binding Zn-finger/Zn-ribbon topoisomerase 1